MDPDAELAGERASDCGRIAAGAGCVEDRLYGFRVGATLRHDAVWYEVNARGARHFLILGALMVALELVLPLGVRNQILTGVAVVGLGVIIVINWRGANRLARQMNL